MKNVIQEEFKIKLILIIYMLKSIFKNKTNDSINKRMWFYIMNYISVILEIYIQLILILF